MKMYEPHCNSVLKPLAHSNQKVPAPVTVGQVDAVARQQVARSVWLPSY